MKTLLQKLIQAESTPEKGELAAAEVVLESFRQSGIESHIDAWEQNRANVIARVEGVSPSIRGQSLSRACRGDARDTGETQPGLLFACHLDVVSHGEATWTYPPFDAVETDGRIYGRGSTDMKGGTAAAITAIRRIVESNTPLKGDLIFVASAGEETDSCGAERFVSNYGPMPALAGVVIPEPTDFAVVTAHRGMLWLEVSTTGKTAHSSTPHLGVNAITSMHRFLNELDHYEMPIGPHELLGKCSMSVNTIEGGKALNVVPDKCRIGIDFRTLPNQDDQRTIDDLERIFAKLKSDDPHFEATISVIRQVQAMETDRHCDFIKALGAAVGIDKTSAIGFTTDGPSFAKLGAPVVIFGPGKPALCHKPDEYIDICDVGKASEHYKNIILRLLT
ncbi:MAG: M20 family metallopeptidase [Sedimentisphaerales bacterium]|nr:M20 family metallopeptidase [Sedimentisphaerales bacterium]